MSSAKNIVKINLSDAAIEGIVSSVQFKSDYNLALKEGPVPADATMHVHDYLKIGIENSEALPGYSDPVVTVRGPEPSKETIRGVSSFRF